MMRLPGQAAVLLPLAVLCALRARVPGEPAPRPVSCAEVAGQKALTVRCTDGKTHTVKSAGLILPPILRCSPSLPECCQTGFRSLRDIQLKDLLRVGEGQPPVCHMLASDIFREKPPLPAPRLDALPEVDDLTPAPQAPRPRPDKGDGNRILVPEAEEVVRRLRDEFDRSGRCPKAALDIGVVMRIYQAAERRAELLPQVPLDVSSLIGKPRKPEGSEYDPGLPQACGYNATFRQWYQTSFHCRDQRLCFDQSHESLGHACVGFGRQKDEPFFYQTVNCRGVPGCHEVDAGECTGAARLTPLGQGVFLRVLLNLRNEPYYYGIVFSATRANTL